MILPPKTIGVLGGGQLGRMFAMEAKRMGYRIWTLDPEPDSPCGQVADGQVQAPFDDLAAAQELASHCDLITYEFENVHVRVVEGLEQAGKEVSPGSRVLEVTQNRLLEKNFLRSHQIPVTGFCKIETLKDLEVARETVGLPAVLKTIFGGYDGKGQIVIQNEQEAEEAFHRLEELSQGKALVWEKFVPFVKELGIICSRNKAGQVVTFPIAENVHRENILHLSSVPARIGRDVEDRLIEIAVKIAEALQIVGTFCVETFLLEDGKVMVNEIAPRVHNCGHYTLDACVTSQFEQHLRAICDLPLGSTELLSPVAMVNLLGEGNGNELIGVEEALRDPKVKLHLYGKKVAKAKRKMGHLTALAGSAEEAIERALSAHKKLRWR
ncbi:MAG: 5-(carboxyamino)imidazole ribonucleotide synthase [Desulfobacterota bacterium]|nr:5-(carboxyamino)imidazole ribonucleotide synthase [Thermodesulfobacteriota bacterium]